MQKIRTSTAFSFEKLFDAGREGERFRAVGKDCFGHPALRVSASSSGDGVRQGDDFFLLTYDEYLSYVREAGKLRLLGLRDRKRMKDELKPVSRAEELASFERVTVRLSGFRVPETLVIVRSGDKAEIARHELDEDRPPERQAVCRAEDMLDLLRFCGLPAWDGFDGKRPPGLLDGTDFRLEAEVNGGTAVRARGSARFPSRFRTLTGCLHAILSRGDGTYRPDGEEPSAEQIETFSSVLLRLSGMRGSQEYEILPKGDRAEVSYYMIRYRDGDDKRDLAERATCGADEFLQLLNSCGILSWDGFRGAHPKDVLDGTMFRFEAVVNGGRTVRAGGSENFPPSFRDFTGGLYRILSAGKDKENTP